MRKIRKALTVIFSVMLAFVCILSQETSAWAAISHMESDCDGYEHRHLILDTYTGEINNNLEDNIFGYTITDSNLYNLRTKKQYINGYFYNASDVYHISDIEGIEIVIQDSNGNKLYEITDVDYSTVEALILPPRTKVLFSTYIIVPKWIEFDLSNIEAVVVCQFSYGKCNGDDCSICGGPIYEKFDTNDKSQTGVSEGMRLCPSCNGNGHCRRCDGSGIYKDALGKYKDCGLCRKNPGVCTSCNGKGEVPIPKPSTHSYYHSDYDFNYGFTDDSDSETRYECSKCKGSGKCQNCGATGRKYGKLCMNCMGDKKCYKCEGKGWISY